MPLAGRAPPGTWNSSEVEGPRSRGPHGEWDKREALPFPECSRPRAAGEGSGQEPAPGVESADRAPLAFHLEPKAPSLTHGGPHPLSPGAINELVLRPTCCLAGMPGPERGRCPQGGSLAHLKLNHAKLLKPHKSSHTFPLPNLTCLPVSHPSPSPAGCPLTRD